MTKLVACVVTSSVIAICSACDMSVDPNQGWTEVTAAMHLGQNISIPLEVSAGESFDVVFNTDGGDNGCYRPADPKVVQTANRVEIEPRILVNTNEGVACDHIFIAFTQRITLRFLQPGRVDVVIRAVSGDSNNSPPDPLTFERVVVVR